MRISLKKIESALGIGGGGAPIASSADAQVASRTHQLAEATSPKAHHPAEHSRNELRRLGYSMVQIHRAFDQDFKVQKPSPGQMSFHALRAFAKESGLEGPANYSDLKSERVSLLIKLETDAMCGLRFALFAQRLHLQDNCFLRGQGDLLGQFSICRQRKALTSTCLVLQAFAFHEADGDTLRRR